MKDNWYSFYQLWYNLKNIFALSSKIFRIYWICHYSVASLLCLISKGRQLKHILTLFSPRANWGLHISQLCSKEKGIILKSAFICVVLEIVPLL